MPRLTIVDPSTDTGPGADLLNGPLKNRQLNILKGMAVNHRVLNGFLEFSKGVKSGSLSQAEHETIALVVAQSRHCEYCTAAHSQAAKSVGIPEDAAIKIRQGMSDDPKRQALIDFVTAVLDTNGFVSDEQLNEFRRAGHDDAAVIEVLGEITLGTFTSLYNHVNETEIDFPVPAAV